MITLRNFTDTDAVILQQYQYHNIPLEEIQKIIFEWSKKEFHGKYFEMFAIVNNDVVVGSISLYQHSPNVISCGLEVFSDFRRQGFGKQAMALALENARSNGYTIALHQVRADNIASIALHHSLHFESDEYIFTNHKGNKVIIMLKILK